MAVEINGEIRSNGTRISKWQRCIMWGKRYSISGELISGFGFMRTISNWEDPDAVGYNYGETEQFAKNKKEIFKHTLKGYK
jgi:hypothetical protein